MVASSPNEGSGPTVTKKKQRSLRKVKASFPEEDSGDDEREQDGIVIRPVSRDARNDESIKQGVDPAAIIAARRQRRKDAWKKVSSVPAGAKPTTLYSSNKEEYSAERMKEMAKMNVKITGSFRKSESELEAGIVGGGFRAPDDVVMVDSSVENGMEPISHDIPDDNFIREAKEKRERMRGHSEMDVDAAYIPLGPFQKRGHQVAEDSIGPDGDDDLEEWMEEQIRKGMSSGAVRGANDFSSLSIKEQRQKRRPSSRDHGEFSSLSSIDPLTLVDSIFNDMNSQLERVKLTCQQHDQGMEKTEENLVDVEKKIQEDEHLLKELDEEFRKSQEMKLYIASLCSMLREKSPIIEELQRQLVKSVESRAKARSERFVVHLDELRRTACKGVDAGMSTLMKGGTDAEAKLASDEAIRVTEEELCLGTHIPISLDEFGRDLNVEKRYKIKRRVTKMKDTFDSMNLLESHKCVEDVISAGESDDDVERFTQRQQDVRAECRSLFTDTEHSFASIESIREHLESWKLRFADQYDATFMGLSTPALFAPFVRLELIDWSPLDPSAVPFNQHHWYLSLFDYGINSPESDPDHDLIPSLVKSIVAPMVVDLCKNAWDPLNLAQSRSLSTIVEDLSIYYSPNGATEILDLFAFVEDRVKEAMELLTPPQWHPSGMKTTVRAKVFWTILFKKSIDLLKCICSFQSLVLVHTFDVLAFDSLGKHIMQLIRACMLECDVCMEMICETLDAIPHGMITGSIGLYPHLGTFLKEISSVMEVLLDASPDQVSNPNFTRAVNMLPPTLKNQYDGPFQGSLPHR